MEVELLASTFPQEKQRTGIIILAQVNNIAAAPKYKYAT